MVQEDRHRAPYAPVASVLKVMHGMRDRGLPEVIGLSALDSLGIPTGNQPRTLAALKFLRLVSGSDRRTDLFERLGRVGRDEYPGVVEEVVRAAYARVFEIRDPAQDDINQITDAFRQYDPSRQRVRMVTLFMGLCREAEIITSEQSARRRTVPSQPAQRRQRAARANGTGGQRQAAASVSADLRAIHAIVDQLPPEGWWTKDRRERWLHMLEGAVDYAVETRSEPPIPPSPMEEEDA